MLLFTGCRSNSAAEGTQELKQYKATYLDIFDTVTVMLGYAQSEEEFQRSSQAVCDELREYHQLFDIYEDYDGINNLKTVNDNAGKQAVKVDQRIIDLLLDCKKIYEASGGLVNVAMGSVLKVWHDAREEANRIPQNAAVPEEQILKEAAKHCDFDTVIIDEEKSTVYLSDSGQNLDVGAIAKGWALEKVCETAPEGMLISVGGNIKATGEKADKSAWVVGVQKPDGENGEYLHTLNVTGGSVVTSGDYQRYYVADGVVYHHIIDPETLYPARYWSAVTVVCEDSGAADALSTALFVTDQANGEVLLEQFDAEAIWIDANGNVFYSDGIKDMIRK